MNTTPAQFGSRIARERKRLHWSQRQLATKSGVNQRTVARAERGDGIGLGNAIALAAALGVSLDALAAPSSCGTCDGFPPTGFTCSECGSAGAP